MFIVLMFKLGIRQLGSTSETKGRESNNQFNPEAATRFVAASGKLKYYLGES